VTFLEMVVGGRKHKERRYSQDASPGVFAVSGWLKPEILLAPKSDATNKSSESSVVPPVTVST
jgi:hypothetical protein